MKDDLLDPLNPPQREAVLHEGSPLLVLSGAGSGKTRVVTHRIAYLILRRNIQPGRILAVTFTNKAAKEMTERIEKLTGPLGRGLWIGTFHSMCTRLLRRNADRLGYPKSFTIYDTDEQKALLKKIIKTLGWDSERWNPNKIRNKISHAKNHLVSVAQMAATAKREEQQRLAKIYELYQGDLKDAGAMDFDDLLNNTVELLADHDDVRLQYQHQFEHVIVDEYQDTNEPQDAITRALAQPQNNLCVVGDDDQSIYRWRGAQFKNILDLPKAYKDLKIVRLEQNYRSTPNILNAAGAVIAHNEDRHKKELWTDRDSGAPIRLFAADTEETEAERVVALIAEAIGEGTSPEGVGVLYRTNAQSRVLEEALLRAKLSYRVVGGFEFYRRKEVKTLLSYMKMLIHPNDDLSFLRIVNNPRRGIGQTTLRQLQAHAGSLGRSLFEAAKEATSHPEIGSAGARKLEELCARIEVWALKLEDQHLAQTLDDIVQGLDYKNALIEEDAAKAEARVENVSELISAFLSAESEITFEMCRPWETEGDTRTPTRAEKLEVFLERATLQSSREDESPDVEAVSLMTLHSAKGLEFSQVFMTGLEEGLFPHEQSMGAPEELEEERRLCYVGMTRAMDRLTMSFAHNRRIWGSSTPTLRSRFLGEIPEELIKPLSRIESSLSQGRTYAGASQGSSYGRSPFLSGRNWDSNRRAATPKRTETPILSKPRTPPPSFLQPGGLVKHRTFGIGTVRRVEGEAPTWKVTVDFRIVGAKTLVQKYAKLEPA